MAIMKGINKMNYSVFFSRIEIGMDIVQDKIKSILPEKPKVVILPWTFPLEIDAERLDNDFFKKGERRYNKYINELKKMGIDEADIKVLNCYKNSKEEIKKSLKESNILFLPGGNPEMLFEKVVHKTEILYDIKYFKGLIIGESAGTELQLKRYFITAKNNYYKYFAFYDGFGIIDDPFYMDVHSTNNKKYLNKLQKVANEKNKDVYAIFDDGVLIYNRETKDIYKFGNVKIFIPIKENHQEKNI